MSGIQLGFVIAFQIIAFGTVDRIQKALQKEEFDKAYDLVIKGLEKEPENPGISYYYASMLFNQAYPGYNLDSARAEVLRVQEKFRKISEEMKTELASEGINEGIVQQLYDQIRDKSFSITLVNLSIETARQHLTDFPGSLYRDILNFKIDSIQFQKASVQKSEEALINFIAVNPTSVFKPRAASMLDDMRFEKLEKSGTLKSYRNFLSQYPLTKHRRTIEKYLLTYGTASGKRAALESFITLSQSSTLRKKAGDVLAMLYPTEDIPNHPKRDSLAQMLEINAASVFPVVEKNKIGFFDTNGKQRIPPTFDALPETPKCELTADSWVFGQNEDAGSIFTKNGNQLLKNIEAYESLSNSVGVVRHHGEWFLYHKSGFRIIDDPIDAAEVMENHWVKIKRGDKWGLVSLLGLYITRVEYDEISQQGAFWIFEKEGLLAAYNEELILGEIEEKGLSLEFKFDDIEFVNDQTMIGFRENRECMLDASLNFLIPWGEYEIYPEQSGWYTRSEKGYRLYNNQEQDISETYYPFLQSNDGWMVLKTTEEWILKPLKSTLPPTRGYDSIQIISKHAVSVSKDGKNKLIFSSGTSIPIQKEQVTTFRTQEDYLLLANKEPNQKILLGPAGDTIIMGNYGDMSFLNDTLVKIQLGKKYGLFDVSGQWILKPLFETLDEKDGLILTLENGKIGTYDIQQGQSIPAHYESRISKLGDFYLCKKNGKYGLIGGEQQQILSFSYDEIKQWDDTSFIVKQDQLYYLVDQQDQQISGPMTSVKTLTNQQDLQIVKFIADGRYGLLSNRHGSILEPEYTDIQSFGQVGHPLFFAEQHLSKAGFHVVSYVDQYGELVLSRAYTNEEFEKVLCDD